MKISLSSLLLIATVTTSVAVDLPFDDIVTFSDSLSDTGNLFELLQGTPFEIPFQRASNGPLANEILASLLELPPQEPSFHLSRGLPASGNNFAYVGANASDPLPPGGSIHLPTQVLAFLASNGGFALANVLYYIAIGGNDILFAGDLLEQAVGTGLDFPQEEGGGKKGKKSSKKNSKKCLDGGVGKKGKKNNVLDCFEDLEVFQEGKSQMLAAAESVGEQLELLAASGAEFFFVLNAPDVGASPTVNIVAERLLQGSETEFDIALSKALPQLHTELSTIYNEALRDVVDEFAKNTPGAKLIYFDLFAQFQNFIENGEDFGFTNTKDPCIFIFTVDNPPVFNPDCVAPEAAGFFFWDEAHGTTQAYALSAADFAESIRGAVESDFEDCHPWSGLCSAYRYSS